MCFSNCVENEMKLYILHLHLLLFFWWVLVGCFFLCVCVCEGFFVLVCFFDWLLFIFLLLLLLLFFCRWCFLCLFCLAIYEKNRSTDLSPSGLIERSIYTREKLHFCDYCWGTTLLFFFFLIQWCVKNKLPSGVGVAGNVCKRISFP